MSDRLKLRVLIKPVLLIGVAGIVYWLAVNAFVIDRLLNAGATFRYAADRTPFAVEVSGEDVVCRLPHLETVALGSTTVTDEALAMIPDDWKVQTFELSSPGITGSGLVHLTRMRELRHLDLTLPNCRPESLSALRERFPQREW